MRGFTEELDLWFKKRIAIKYKKLVKPEDSLKDRLVTYMLITALASYSFARGCYYMNGWDTVTSKSFEQTVKENK